MAKFIVQCSETVYYRKMIEAENEAQVREMIYEGELDCDFGDIDDNSGFQIDFIEQAKTIGE
jgi:hypothetical protein